jgi:phenylalanyl-tRNA synthetase alpha chain
MDGMIPLEDILYLPEELRPLLAAAGDPAAVAELERRYLGKPSLIKQAFKEMGAIPASERPAVAAVLNEVQEALKALLADGKARIVAAARAERLAAEWQDLTLPGVASRRGARHPVAEIERRCLAVLRQLGFQLEEGPEVETEFHNFDALNIPAHHPARDMQDTFFVEGGRILRSHTTTVQARILEKRLPLPIKVASAGRVYRNEAVDATHLAMFHQLEGFWLEEGLTFAHLKGILRFVASGLYGAHRQFRFKPKFYPYTEPSLGMDIACVRCAGAGCVSCHGAGWVTIIGAGMIHRNVLVQFGYDADKVAGIAFGWGTTRMASQWAGVEKVRSLYEQDLRLFHNMLRRTESGRIGA